MLFSLFIIVPPPVLSHCFALYPLWLCCGPNTYYSCTNICHSFTPSCHQRATAQEGMDVNRQQLISGTVMTSQVVIVEWGGMERGNKTETRKSDCDRLWKCNYSLPTCMEVITVIYLCKFTVIVLVNWDLWLTLFDILCHERSLILSPSHWACHPLIHSLFVSCLLLEPAPALSFQLQRQLFMHRSQGKNILFFLFFFFFFFFVECPRTW